MGGPAPTPLTEEAERLLAELARRPLVGPLRRSVERDRLRRLGLIISHTPDFRKGQDTHWLVTAKGAAHLAGRVTA